MRDAKKNKFFSDPRHFNIILVRCQVSTMVTKTENLFYDYSETFERK